MTALELGQETVEPPTTKEQLIAAIRVAEERLEELNRWAISVHMNRLRDLQGRLLELEAWEAEPKLYSGL